jgi:hypothetical protein
MPMRHNLFILLAVAFTVTTLSCGRREPAEWTVAVQRVGSPASANSSEPQLAVSDRGVLLSWLERVGTTNHLKFAERTASGWTAPLTAASGADWFLSYADVPSVQRMTDGTLVAQWLQTTDPVTEAYNLLLSYSKDNAKTWAPSFMPHHDGTKTQHGFASMVDMPGSGLGVVWLDGRNSEFLDNKPESGTMTLRFAAFDATWKQTADAEVDRRVCECCSTTAVVTSDGVLTAFRDRDDKEVRDMGVSRLENGRWTPTTLISQDNWMIDLCPVNGPMLSARGRDVAAAWFTVKNDQGQALAAFSSDAGRTWSAPVRLDDGGSLGRVDVEMLDDGSALATWVEYAEGRSDFRARRIDRAGARSAPITVAGVSGGRASGFPKVARRGNELVFAWTASAAPEGSADGALQVYTAVAALP